MNPVIISIIVVIIILMLWLLFWGIKIIMKTYHSIGLKCFIITFTFMFIGIGIPLIIDLITDLRN